MNVRDQWLINFAWLIISVCSIMAHQLFCESQIPHRRNQWYSLTCRLRFVQIKASLFKYVQCWHTPYVCMRVFFFCCNLFAYPRSHLTRERITGSESREKGGKSKFMSPHGDPYYRVWRLVADWCIGSSVKVFFGATCCPASPCLGSVGA